MQKLIIFIYSISLGFGANYFQQDLSLLYRGQEKSGTLNIPSTLRLVGIMAQFPLEVPDNPTTSGDGNFLNLDHEEYNHFYASTRPRCDGFIVDRPPHNAAYFQKQLEAVGNYYYNISGYKLPYTANIITNATENGYYTVSKTMEDYAKSDQLLAEFFSETLDLAKLDIEDYFGPTFSLIDSVVFVVFHAGLGQDFSYPSLDPTIYDLKSAYIDEKMMEGVTPTVIYGEPIMTGVLLPETMNIIYYDVSEDIFGNPDYGTDNLCDIQIGLTGIFALNLGYELGLPPMFNPITGDPGIGYFGLMDHGSNNGRGVIPAPPSPWTRSLPDSPWPTVERISPLQSLDTTITVFALDLLNTLYRIDISENEYFLIENRNNWVAPEMDIDSLRRKHKIFYPNLGDSLMGHWFDAVTNDEENFIKNNLIEIDPETQVIIGLDHYDYGLPGSGILIWHIKEPDPAIYYDGINNNIANRHVQIEEADGAQDIGTKSYAFFTSDDPTAGTSWDMWFLGNKGYEFANASMDDKVFFDAGSSPNTRTTNGSQSFLSIEILSEISDSMDIRIIFNNGIEIVNLTDEPVHYLGNAYDSENSSAAVFYEKDGLIYKHSSDSVITQINTLQYIEGNLIYTYQDNVEYLESQNCIHPICKNIVDEILPHGFTDSFNDSIPVQPALSLGDIDLDGLDEIITIENGDIIARNSNGTLVNGFPTHGDFSGVPLIANILPPQYGKDVGKPEIICREGNDIVILSNKGERLPQYQLSSYDIDQPLAMVPFWRGDTTMALIDGSRLFLFELDMEHSYWMNPRSQPSGFPLSTGEHFDPADREFFRKSAYNYPNPITDGATTFRFYVGSTETSEVQVHIYNAAGYLVIDDLVNSQLTPHEFNEIQWDASQVDAGLYFAEIKPNSGSSELVRLVVIK